MVKKWPAFSNHAGYGGEKVRLQPNHFAAGLKKRH
jgi:hypothetical protein